MNTFRDRDRKKYHAVGGSYDRPQPKSYASTHKNPYKPKGPAAMPGIPCRVKNSVGEFYDVIPNSKLLFINESNPDGHIFPSHYKASRCIWHSIENMKSHNFEWDLKEFVVVDV